MHMLIKCLLMLFMLYQSSLFAGKFNCDDSNTMFPTKQEYLVYLNELSEKYGSTDMLVEILGNEDSVEFKKLDDYFYSKFGAYIYSELVFEQNANKNKALKNLIRNGVHPYEEMFDKGSIVNWVIIFDDRAGFDAFYESEKLEECQNKLEKLIEFSESNKKNYYADKLRELLNKTDKE